MGFRRYVAVGDSLTQGAGDPHHDGTLRGFADLLACATGSGYANLARSSVRCVEIHRDQVPAAVALAPDLVTAIVGVNDIIAVRLDRNALGRAVDGLLADLRRGLPRAVIATATLPDLSHLSRVARVWRQRVVDVNAAIRDSAAANDVVLVDLDKGPRFTLAELAIDRVHPSPRGHLRMAVAFADALDLPRPAPVLGEGPIRARSARRVYRTVAVAPRFVARRAARGSFIAGQPPKRPDLSPL